MLGMQYNTNLQTKGVLEVGCFASSISSAEAKCKKDGNFTSNEPISVLDTRSPSPSTSTSTLSSSFGGTNGGGTSENTPNLVVGSHRNTLKGAAPLDPITTASATNGEGGGVKEEWVTELPAGLELSQDGPERYNLGLEDWETFLCESTGQDQSLIRWIAGDIEDPSFSMKQLLQGGNSNEIESNVGVGGIDQSSGFEALATGGCTADNGNVLPTLSSSPLGLSGSGNSFDSNNGKFGSVPSSLNSNNKNGNSQNLFPLPPNSSLGMPDGVNVAHQQQLQFATIPEQKSPNFMPHVMISTPQFQNAPNLNLLNSLLSCTNQDQPQPKRQNLGILNPAASSQIPKVPLLDPDPNLLLRKQQELQFGLGQQLNSLPSSNPQQKPFIVPKQEVAEGNGNLLVARHQQQVVYDQLYKATELVLAGNFSHAQGILARLNHQLSPAVKPFQRAAFYFKEALQLLLLLPNRAISPSLRIPTPLDGIFKMGAYKMLSEVSPLIQFKNFTSNQALLEALDDAANIHIIDFDIGCGAQWSSFMQELPRKNRGATSLKITAFASPSAYHSVEISLMHESLTHFANDLGLKFELEVVNFDSFDPSGYSASSFRSSESDTIAVNFPLWSVSSRPTILPSLLCFIKQLSPKIVVMLDHGCERFELPPSHHLLNALQYYEVFLDSVDAANMASDAVNKIERFLIQPTVESIVFGRLQSPNQIPPWTNLFASAGFSSVPISNFAETQAECVVKRSQVRGFHVEKRQASLVLSWQRRELLSASVWKC
ncbi:unnamed protein product [Coffea canephora]|uniref:Uncharacterized protein n=1 Tax=Coffea canephora TaxID=49390 RepID=A0A068UNP8_COFCA|nr:unnamed protein product [Coffea canephora]